MLNAAAIIKKLIHFHNGVAIPCENKKYVIDTADSSKLSLHLTLLQAQKRDVSSSQEKHFPPPSTRYQNCMEKFHATKG